MSKEPLRVFVVDIEAHEQRYTKQWREHLPELIRAAAATFNRSVEVITISGDEPDQVPTAGAFLNFSQTNIYKSQQVIKVAGLFDDGKVRAGDKFLFTDAWNPGIISVKYMCELLDVPAEIFGMWHAGSYDEWDFLGRKIKDKRWSLNFERSLFHAIDVNCFATQFHIDMFEEALGLTAPDVSGKMLRTGWCMEYMADTLEPYRQIAKRNLVLFPHRLAPEKQLNIFTDLASEFPDYEFLVCQEQSLSKHEYHKLLGAAVMVFSANLQETLGISAYEGVVCGAAPCLPDRLSYTEMYDEEWLYPSKWTENTDAYFTHKAELGAHMRRMFDEIRKNSAQVRSRLKSQEISLSNEFFSAGNMFNRLFDSEV
jgi:hypothetical protein